MQKNNISHQLILGFGSNEGDSKTILKNAYNLVQSEIGKIISISGFYTTQPWGNSNQSDFLNSVGVFQTEFTTHECLTLIQNIENQLGRIRKEKWGSRKIDIDILFYDNEIINENNIIVPHPEIQNRKFVLEPLFEVFPTFIHPKFNKCISEILKECKDECDVRSEM